MQSLISHSETSDGRHTSKLVINDNSLVYFYRTKPNDHGELDKLSLFLDNVANNKGASLKICRKPGIRLHWDSEKRNISVEQYSSGLYTSISLVLETEAAQLVINWLTGIRTETAGECLETIDYVR